MKAMILAAGKGERMLPLTRVTPKPLLLAGGKALIQYHLEALAAAGFQEIIINTGPLGGLIQEKLGNGSQLGLLIRYSHEGDEPLGTGGGVQKALPLLGHKPFLLINGDIWTDLNYQSLSLPDQAKAHLVLVDNPPHHPDGDFCLREAQVEETGATLLTYSGIGVFDPDFFSGPGSMFSFVPALRRAMRRQEVTGEYYRGRWYDIGTPGRLRDLDRRLQSV